MRSLKPFLLAALALVSACGALAEPAGPTLTLDDAIALALKRNKNLIVVSFGRDISRANLLVARGQFDPALFANRIGQDSVAQQNTGLVQLGNVPLYDYRQDTYTAGIEGTTPFGTSYQVYESAVNGRYSFYGYQSDYQTFGGVQITQHLLKGFGFGANLVNVRIMKANRDISDWAYRQSAIATVTNVVLAYSNLQLAHDQLDSARRSHDLAASLLAGNEKEYAVGSISQSEVITARANVAQQEEPILVAERAVRDAQNQLRELVGDEVFLDDEPLFTLVPQPVPDVHADVRADLEKALQLRPDYQQARLGIVKFKAAESAARNGVLPQVDFVGGYGYNGFASTLTASRQLVDRGDNPSYSAGLQVTVPLTFAVGRGTLRSARLQRQQADVDLKRLESDIAVAVATAVGQIETTKKRVAADHASYDLAMKALDAEEKKKLAGSSTTLAVVQQQGFVSLAEASIAAALASQRQAVALYDETLGTTLDRYHITLATP